MNVEKRKRGKRTLYYLAHSFRDNDRVRKVRRYIGADLSPRELERLRKVGEKHLMDQVSFYREIRDPLKTVISEREVESIRDMISKADIRISHLSEEEWLRFTEIFTYDTNAIEGSTVSYSEVRGIIEKNEWPKEKSKGEVSETYGVSDAISHIRKTKDHVSLNLIKELHRIVFKNSKDFAGKFRGKGVEVVVADRYGNVIHRGAPQSHVVKLLNELIKWYDENRGKYHPIVLAAIIHNQFENIHPFQDGNGRVGRLLLNNILLKNGLPPVNIELKNRAEYYSSLQAYEKLGNLRPTIELILKEYGKMKNALKTV